MIIIGNFKVVPSKGSTGYDLFEQKVIQKGKNKGLTVDDVMGYDMRLERVVETLAFRFKALSKDEADSLKSEIELMKKYIQEVADHMKGIL